MNTFEIEYGSFRDPGGTIFYQNQSVFRSVMPVAKADYEFVRDSGLLEELISQGMLVETQEINTDKFVDVEPDASYILKHEKIPFISYPYEWSFQALKDAALCQLAVHIKALKYEVTLSDATAYNIQFLGTKPVFIDCLSLRKYYDGEFWTGHSQFCQQFLNPLLMRSLFDVPYNSWFRGELEGVPTADLKKLLTLPHKFSPKIWLHVILPDMLQNKFSGETSLKIIERENSKRLPKARLQNMLEGLSNWIRCLSPKGGKTVWGEYADNNSYNDRAAEQKFGFIKTFIRTTTPDLLWDLGCNTGTYSEASLSVGAKRVIGFDFDLGALDGAFERGKSKKLDFLPLFLNATNPSPNQGWAQRERRGLIDRKGANALLALAFVHHMTIGSNIPLDQVIAWITDLAPEGVIEFVPKSDPMIKKMLVMRKDIFPNYDEKNFLISLKKRCRIVKTCSLTGSQRKLFWYSQT